MRIGIGPLATVVVALVATACGHASSSTQASPTGSEVAVSVVSGGLNNTGASGLALRAPAAPKRSPLQRTFDFLNPIGTAWAATWTCTGGLLSPAFGGPSLDPYSYTPWSCSVTWGNDRTASSSWSGAFTLNYGPTCDSTDALLGDQGAGCELTRTTAATGNTRTITGPDGNSYAITHNTNGAGTGWDASVSPAPTDDGVQLTSTSLVISGSHLTGTVTIGNSEYTIWDHTVSTATGGLTISGTGTTRVVTGAVTVQHNLAKFTSTTTFNSVGYGACDCCFPTTGSVTTTVVDGANAGKTETMSFTPLCGETTLTTGGVTEAITLEHCL